MTLGMPAFVERDAILRDVRRGLLELLESAVEATQLGVPGLRPERILDALARVVSMTQDLWDVEPRLVASAVGDGLEMELARLVALLDTSPSGPAELRTRIVAQLLDFAPSSVVAAAQRGAAAGDVTGERAVRAWSTWGDRPLRVRGPIEDELGSPRRWRRICAAIELRTGGGPDLVDHASGELDAEALAHWRRSLRPPHLPELE